jgi:hypothetical protein
MGAFADLTATSIEYEEFYDVMKKAQPLFSTASSPEEVLRTEALNAIKLDIQHELGLLPSDSEDMTDLDDIAEGQAALMRSVLAFKQLAMVCSHPQIFQSTGSRNAAILSEARKRYERYRSGFSGLRTRVGLTRTIARRMRR